MIAMELVDPTVACTAMACTAKEASTDMVHSNIIHGPGHRDLIRAQIDIPHYTITDALGQRDLIMNTITDASQATRTVTTRLLMREDETESGHLNDTQENKVTMYSETDGAWYALQFEYSMFVVTFVRYVQKTTSHICLNFETVAMLSKFVHFDSGICFELTPNEVIKSLGFCGTRKQIFFQNVSSVVVMRLLPQNSCFGCAPVLCGLPQDLKVSKEVSQIEWQSQRAHQSIKLFEFDSYIFTQRKQHWFRNYD